MTLRLGPLCSYTQMSTFLSSSFLVSFLSLLLLCFVHLGWLQFVFGLWTHLPMRVPWKLILKLKDCNFFPLLIKPLFSHFPADIWSDHSFRTDPDLPPGWKRVNDIAGTYYWHIPTGTTQWERPVSVPADLQGSRKGSLSSVTPSPTPENEVRWSVFLMA